MKTSTFEVSVFCCGFLSQVTTLKVMLKARRGHNNMDSENLDITEQKEQNRMQC